MSSPDPASYQSWTPSTHLDLGTHLERVYPESMASEIIAWHAWGDPDNCPDEARAALLGPNWRAAIQLLQHAYELAPEQARRIAQHRIADDEDYEAAWDLLPGHVRTSWDVVAEAVEAVEGRGWGRDGPCWVADDALRDALVATIGGDSIPERLRDRLMHAWHKGTAV